MQKYTGGCVCGHIRYTVTGEPLFPHLCTCPMCQRWSGAPALGWVDFKRSAVVFHGPGGEPALYRSPEPTQSGFQRGFCPICGSPVCALDDGAEEIALTIGTLDEPSSIVPESQSYPESAPSWLRIEAVAPATHEPTP